MADECMHCGVQLPSDWQQPCPACGKTGKVIKVFVVDGVNATDDHSMGITQGETGRFAIHSDSRSPTDSVRIEQLIREFVEGAHTALEEYIESLVVTFSSAALFEGTFFRGVKSTTRLNEDKIGPSPTRTEGRYNGTNEKALYLIDDVAFLAAELGSVDLLVQEYRIALAHIRVGDLTPDNKAVSNSLSLLLQAAERGKTGAGFDFESELTTSGHSKYLISLSIAASFKRNGWQGLYVPGVHGRAGGHYKNLAIFGDSIDSWQEWTIGIPRGYTDGVGWIS